MAAPSPVSTGGPRPYAEPVRQRDGTQPNSDGRRRYLRDFRLDVSFYPLHLPETFWKAPPIA